MTEPPLDTPSEFAPGHDDALAAIAEARNYNAWLFGRAASYLGTRVLDVGAGIGTFADLAANGTRKVIALEPDAPFAAHLRKRFDGRSNIEVVEGGVDDLDSAVSEASFDSIICFNVLEHLAGDEVVLRRFRDLLAPGGHLFLLVPAHEWLSSPFDEDVGHERRYTAGAIRTLLERAGLEPAELRYVNPVGAVGWLVSMRLRRRHVLPTGQVRLFDRLVPFIRPLDALRLPFGQSLWAVARKP
jgi:SAM-dependent methyltransferase